MVEVSSGTDVLLALLYAKGSTGKNNEPIAGTTKLEKFMFLLSKETDLTEPISNDYEFSPDDYGPCAHEIFDDVEMLKDAKFIEEKERNIFSSLDEGDREACQDFENENQPCLKVFSLTEKGLIIGKAMFNALSTENQQKIVKLKQLYNKRPVNEIVRNVYVKYPEMIGKSKIRKKILA